MKAKVHGKMGYAIRLDLEKGTWSHGDERQDLSTLAGVREAKRLSLDTENLAIFLVPLLHVVWFYVVAP